MVGDECARIADEAGSLRRVQYLFEPTVPKLITAVRLGFTGGDWVVEVNEQNDTVELNPAADEAVARWCTAEASGQFPWAAAIGKNIAWAWTLENHHGYLDGLQLEFTDPVRGGDVAIQLVCEASALEVKAVISLETPYLRARA
jgi:hypothetical protein